ncbi:MAG: hypothetical protein FWH12_02370 [Treponema sp.]|nr:hypothetical protein [Treponema sp.]
MGDWRGLLNSEKAIMMVAKQPHLLGHIIGKDKLTPVHSDWIRYIWDTNQQRALMAYRGSYKTTAICTIGTIRWMLFNPDDRIAIFRKNVGHSADVVNTVAQAMQYTEVAEIFKYRFGEYPNAKIQRNGALQYTFKKTITPEPNVIALGVSSGDITGKHFDKIIIDDFATIRDRVSRAERQHTKLSLMEIQTNIIDPKKGVGYIGTPWHRDDAWKYVNSLCPVAKYPISRYGSIVGEDEVKNKKATTTPALYAANYELDLISDESLLFQDPVYSKGWDYTNRSVAQLDTAYDGNHFCALTIASAIKGEGENTVYQVVGFTYPGNIRDWYDTIVSMCKKYRVTALHEESNADKGMSANDLTKKGLNVISYSERQSKHYKISTHLYKVWRNIEWAPETDDEYMAQIIDYQEGSTPDDAPDSAASLFREAFFKNIAFDEEHRNQMASRRMREAV